MGDVREGDGSGGGVAAEVEPEGEEVPDIDRRNRPKDHAATSGTAASDAVAGIGYREGAADRGGEGAGEAEGGETTAEEGEAEGRLKKEASVVESSGRDGLSSDAKEGISR